MDRERTLRRQDFLVNAAYILFILAGVVIAARWLLSYLMPLVLAFPLAAALQRPRRWLEKRLAGGSRAAAGILVGVVLALAAALVILAVWRLAVFMGQHPVSSLWHETGEWQKRLEESLGQWERELGARLSPELGQTLSGLRTQLTQELSGALSAWFTETAGRLASTVAARLPGWIISALVFVMAATALTVEYEQVWSFLLRQLPESRQKTVTAARALCREAARRLLQAYGLLMGTTFLELLAGLWLLGVSGALRTAAAIALVDILPVLGAGTALLPWAAVCLLTGETSRGLGLLALWGVISLVRQLLEPRVVGKQMGLPPLVMLAVMLLGFRLSGFGGLILFPVLAMLIRELHSHGYLHIWK